MYRMIKKIILSVGMVAGLSVTVAQGQTNSVLALKEACKNAASKNLAGIIANSKQDVLTNYNSFRVDLHNYNVFCIFYQKIPVESEALSESDRITLRYSTLYSKPSTYLIFEENTSLSDQQKMVIDKLPDAIASKNRKDQLKQYLAQDTKKTRAALSKFFTDLDQAYGLNQVAKTVKPDNSGNTLPFVSRLETKSTSLVALEHACKNAASENLAQKIANSKQYVSRNYTEANVNSHNTNVLCIFYQKIPEQFETLNVSDRRTLRYSTLFVKPSTYLSFETYQSLMDQRKMVIDKLPDMLASNGIKNQLKASVSQNDNKAKDDLLAFFNDLDREFGLDQVPIYTSNLDNGRGPSLSMPSAKLESTALDTLERACDERSNAKDLAIIIKNAKQYVTSNDTDARVRRHNFNVFCIFYEKIPEQFEELSVSDRRMLRYTTLYTGPSTHLIFDENTPRFDKSKVVVEALPSAIASNDIKNQLKAYLDQKDIHAKDALFEFFEALDKKYRLDKAPLDDSSGESGWGPKQ